MNTRCKNEGKYSDWKEKTMENYDVTALGELYHVAASQRRKKAC